MKGNNSYKPQVGETVLISPPNSDNQDGYVYQEYRVLWINEDFILYGVDHCWPNLHKLEHVHIKKLNKFSEENAIRKIEQTTDANLELIEQFCDHVKMEMDVEIHDNVVVGFFEQD